MERNSSWWKWIKTENWSIHKHVGEILKFLSNVMSGMTSTRLKNLSSHNLTYKSHTGSSHVNVNLTSPWSQQLEDQMWNERR